MVDGNLLRETDNGILMAHPLLFVGDPHGRTREIAETIREHHPDAAGVVFLGDLELAEPLEAAVEALPEGMHVGWIPGNRESDRPEFHDRLYGSELAGGCLHARVIDFGGVRIAGLGGVFRRRVWYPGAEPHYTHRDAFRWQLAREAMPEDDWREGLPLRAHTSIWPEDIEQLQGQRADILVTHEAPSCHPHGFAVIDELAQAMGAHTIVHGHHHQRYEAQLANGLRVLGVDLGGILALG